MRVIEETDVGSQLPNTILVAAQVAHLVCIFTRDDKIWVEFSLLIQSDSFV